MLSHLLDPNTLANLMRPAPDALSPAGMKPGGMPLPSLPVYGGGSPPSAPGYQEPGYVPQDQQPVPDTSQALQHLKDAIAAAGRDLEDGTPRGQSAATKRRIAIGTLIMSALDPSGQAAANFVQNAQQADKERQAREAMAAEQRNKKRAQRDEQAIQIANLEYRAASDSAAEVKAANRVIEQRNYDANMAAIKKGDEATQNRVEELMRIWREAKSPGAIRSAGMAIQQALRQMGPNTIPWAPSDADIEQRAQDAHQEAVGKAKQEWRLTIKDRLNGSYVPETDAEGLKKQRDALAEYYQIDPDLLDPVPTHKSLGMMRLEEKVRASKAGEGLRGREIAIRDKQVAAQIAAAAERNEIARDQLNIARTRADAYGRWVAAQNAKAYAGNARTEYDKTLEKLQGELAAAQAVARRTGKPEDVAKAEGIQGKIDYYESLKDGATEIEGNAVTLLDFLKMPGFESLQGMTQGAIPQGPAPTSYQNGVMETMKGGGETPVNPTVPWQKVGDGAGAVEYRIIPPGG